MSEKNELGSVLDTAWANLVQTNGGHPAEFINAHVFSSIAKSLYVLARIEVSKLPKRETPVTLGAVTGVSWEGMNP